MATSSSSSSSAPSTPRLSDHTPSTSPIPTPNRPLSKNMADASHSLPTTPGFPFPFRARGHTTSSLRKLSPSPNASPMSRATSVPEAPNSDAGTPSMSTLSPSPPSPSEKDRHFWSISGAQASRTSLHGASSSWWSRIEIVPRPWKETPRRKKTIPPEQTEAWLRTRERVSQAAIAVLGTAGDVTHELLAVSADVLRFSPILGLGEAARVLLNIWDSLQLVDMNRLACLRLTERCADILMSVREEIAEAGDYVGEELRDPLAKLLESFTQVQGFLHKQLERPFIMRYLKRDEILQQIAQCDTSLSESLGLFSIKIQIRILRQVQEAELRRQADTQALLSSLIGSGSAVHEAPSLLLGGAHTSVVAAHPPSYAAATDDLPPLRSFPLVGESPVASPVSIPSPTIPATSTEIRNNLRALHARQNQLDQVHDVADLRQLMNAALLTSNDAELIEVLQVARDEMPEAIKTLQRALEREVLGSSVPAVERKESIGHGVGFGVSVGVAVSSVGSPTTMSAIGALVQAQGIEDPTRDEQQLERRGTITSKGSGGSSGMTAKDLLDREFIESGLDALRRVSHATSLPSWTITRYEVEREEKIGIGFFSDVHRGTWRNATVAIKVLAPTTPRDVFVREVEIWKGLRHPNVLELYGASSACGDPPWFFVSPYLEHGSLVKYLKGVSAKAKQEGKVGNGEENVDMLKMMHEVARGMEYLHGKGVLHGDLKCSNVLVDNKTRCVIADFGQSEMKSEAYRISGTSPPPQGTLRWQSPELMAGQIQLTNEVDIYAYAICCVEILTMGSLPWSHADDDAVRRFVLQGNSRPPFPRIRVVTNGLLEVLAACWHRDPFRRPKFSQIVRDIRGLRKSVGTEAAIELDDSRKPSPRTGRLGPEVVVMESPDMRPVPLPITPQTPPLPISSGSSSELHRIAVGAANVPVPASPPTHEPYVPAGQVQTATSQTVYFIQNANASRTSSIFTTTPGGASDGTFEDDRGTALDTGYDSPSPANERIAELRNERRYRMLLEHDFHRSLTLPLWTPTPVALGDVGYLSKPSGGFVTLMNALEPHKNAEDGLKTLPSMHGYGVVKTGSQRQDKRSFTQKGFDKIAGLLRFGQSQSSRSVSRRYSFPLRAGHRTAYMCTESTEYRYIEDLGAPKDWFKANADNIIKVFGRQHGIHKEDLYLVIGALDAQEYALFVSHQHPDGQGHFNVFSTQRPGQEWGMFTTDTEVPSELGGPSYQEEVPRYADRSSANKVSVVEQRWHSVLLAKLRFKPDVAEPTSL